MLNKLVLALAGAGLMHSLTACAEPKSEAKDATPAKPAVTTPAPGDVAAVQAFLEAKLEGLKIASISVSEYPALLEIMADGRIFYASLDGKYLLVEGVMLRVGDDIANVTQERMAEIDKAMAPQRAKDIEALGEDSMIVFKAAKEKHKVTVFTDVDCGYCRKLHSQMAQYNDAGITIRYTAFPRGGIPSESYDKLSAVWCADDRKAAMNLAKGGGKVPGKQCQSPIEKHYALVRKLNLSGTPALILADGTLMPGYVPPAELSAVLDKKQAGR
jgi:thiol:disulfide interchange protein DsbC